MDFVPEIPWALGYYSGLCTVSRQNRKEESLCVGSAIPVGRE